MKKQWRILDIYITRKFLGTFFYALLLIMAVAVIFDFSEKLDDFIEKEAPLRAVIFDYYLNFIPYFAILFAPLFTFITVIFFTSKMAFNTEIIAILSSGISFRRFLMPYMFSALIIAGFSFVVSNYVLPHANYKRLSFEEKHLKKSSYLYRERNFHRQVYPNIYMYLETFSNLNNIGQKFSLEEFGDDGRLKSKLMADYVQWNKDMGKWTAHNYYIRYILPEKDSIVTGYKIDTVLTVTDQDFKRRKNFAETMNLGELNSYIDLLTLQGSDELKMFQVEKYKRFANPFSVFILTLIGVSLSSRKVRGGIGMQIGLGILLSFSYILISQFSSQFSMKGGLNPMLAMWIPNMVYLAIGLVLYRIAPK